MFLNLFKRKQKHLTPKVRIIAIASNEAAYLPEWIYHHLYFGFDSIEVLINRTTDNTYEIVDATSDNSYVNFIDADDIFVKYPMNPQIACYREAFKRAVSQGVTHVLFIDIDEFWTPLDLNSNIHQFLDTVDKADVYAFEWCNKIEPFDVFNPAIDKQITVERATQVKSLLNVHSVNQYKAISKMNPHNVIHEKLSYLLANNDKFVAQNQSMSRVLQDELYKPVKPAFILHRKCRSQYEYIALLGRVNPEQQKSVAEPIKSNRRLGFPLAESGEQICFELNAVQQYQSHLSTKLAPLSNIIRKSQERIEKVYMAVLHDIAHADAAAHKLIRESLANIELDDVKNALDKMSQSVDAR